MNDHDIFQAVLQTQDEGQDIALATVIKTSGSVPRRAGSKLLIWADGRILGTVGGGKMESLVIEAGQQALREGKTQILNYQFADPESGDVGVCGGTADVFVEPLLAIPTVLVVGCGHVGKAVAELAKWLGFRVIVSDDRAETCSEEHIPGMDEYVIALPGELVDRIAISSQTYIAAMTRGQEIDLALLPSVVDSPARYIGLIGSRRRWALTADALRERGWTDEQFARIHAPVGLELGAETPNEIAASILAEIIMIRRGGDGQPMRQVAIGSNSSD